MKNPNLLGIFGKWLAIFPKFFLNIGGDIIAMARKLKFYLTVEAAWLAEFGKLKTALCNSGLSRSDWPAAVGVSASDISNLCNDRRYDTYHSHNAGIIVDALRNDAAHHVVSVNPDILKCWVAQKSLRHWLAKDLVRQVEAERARIERSALEPITPPVANIPVGAPQALEPTNSLKPLTGNTTGEHALAIPELVVLQAEWRDTNLAPGEGRWLQLDLRFGQSYTRAEGINLDVDLHRVHINVDLDNGEAAERDRWEETSADGHNQITVFPSVHWSPNAPTFQIDNPTSQAPLTGRFRWFNFLQETKPSGDAAFLTITASIGGIGIAIPQTVKKQLDPDKRNEYDLQEERAIAQWLRLREIPKDLRTGGMWQLAHISLSKVDT